MNLPCAVSYDLNNHLKAMDKEYEDEAEITLISEQIEQQLLENKEVMVNQEVYDFESVMDIVVESAEFTNVIQKLSVQNENLTKATNELKDIIEEAASDLALRLAFDVHSQQEHEYEMADV